MSIVTPTLPSVGAAGQETIAKWKLAMRDAVRSPRELCRLLELPTHFARSAIESVDGFPLFVPRSFVARIKPGDPNDPLLRQVLPIPEEGCNAEGFGSDPVGDAASSLMPGLIQKYHGRVLLMVAGTCAVNCRYCFRRHFPYDTNTTSPNNWTGPLAQIMDDSSITEVILSGGDPLVLDDGVLADLASRLAAIPHIQRIRVHTRLPVMIPQRVTNELIALLRATRLAPIIVVHVNHAAELSKDVCQALRMLVDSGIPVLNQAVLLKGVNDNADSLEVLCLKLVNNRIMPYYLNQLDRVAGAGHFDVPIDRGRKLMNELRLRLPGYAVPRYVMEQVGEPFKVPLDHEL